MKYEIVFWPISHLLEIYNNGKINLSPDYQRNAIWSKNAQNLLIDSLKIGFPLPTFFIKKVSQDNYEMVDGQQRSRAIIRYFLTKELDNPKMDENKYKRILSDYLLNITIITHIENTESIEDFYYRVNSTGLHLNRPEKIKAKNLNSKFFTLAENIVHSNVLTELGLFSESSLRRMLDRDLIEEIFALIQYGITEKKKQVDLIYEDDITDDDVNIIESKFLQIINIIQEFNKIKPIKNTRYRQRNDFYTLVSFLLERNSLSQEVLNYLYNILIIIDNEIKPSKFTAKPFAEYAQNCVSQSNSENARKERLRIISDILISNDINPNEIQTEIISYYKYGTDLINVDGIFSFDNSALSEAIKNSKAQFELFD
jgi:hypothetical protein